MILEYAYLWALACVSCKFSLLDFDELVARIQCEDIQPGYMFQKNKSLDSALKCALLYARRNHPCAVIFFKDDTGALYLVDVGGSSNMSKTLHKVHKMNDVLVKEGMREDLQVSELEGVVLLPNIVNIRLENEEISEAITVTKARARLLLGGLAQVLAWLPTVWSPKLAKLTTDSKREKQKERLPAKCGLCSSLQYSGFTKSVNI